MATKKTTAKKPTASKATAAKTSVKKTPVKKAAPKKTTNPKTRTSAAVKSQSFKIVENTEPFMTFRLNRQTIYWTIFGAAVIALALWVANLQRNINELYDQIEQNQAESQMLLPAEIEALKKQKAEKDQRAKEEKASQ
jgi:HAMP domain-containing protein